MSKIKIQSAIDHINYSRNFSQGKSFKKFAPAGNPIGYLSDGTLKYDFKGGIRRIIKLTQSIDERPVFIAIWGQSHAGKTHLAYNLTKEFAKFGLHPSGCTKINGSLRIPKNTDFCLLQCSGYREEYQEGVSNIMSYYTSQDPISLVKRAGKRVHINVYIYNPHFQRGIEGEYELVIENPDSVIKKLPPKKVFIKIYGLKF